jgi:hypothetical protein
MAQMAERVGFEPTVGFPTLAFQASTFGHSVIPPKKIQTVFGIEVAEEAGFEPAVGFPTMDFESTAFVHSATPPKRSLLVPYLPEKGAQRLGCFLRPDPCGDLEAVVQHRMT